MPEITANGVQLYYEFHGPEDGDVVVLSNGIMMSTAAWAYQTAALAKYFRVLLYDCRGMWRSEHPAGPYSMEQHADDLAALLDALNIEKAHIAGISYGSEISMVFALRHPEKAKTLIVMDGVSQIDPMLNAQTLPWLIAAERKDAELLLRTSVPFNYGEDWISAHQAAIDASVPRFAQLDMDAMVELMKAFYKLDITDQLDAIKVPTLVVIGEDDLIKGRKYSDIIVQHIPHAEYAIVPRAGHALCIDKPDILNSLLIGFILKYS